MRLDKRKFERELADICLSQTLPDNKLHYWIRTFPPFSDMEIYGIEKESDKIILSIEKKKIAEYKIADLRKIKNAPKQLSLF